MKQGETKKKSNMRVRCTCALLRRRILQFLLLDKLLVLLLDALGDISANTLSRTAEGLERRDAPILRGIGKLLGTRLQVLHIDLVYLRGNQRSRGFGVGESGPHR